MAFKLDTKIFNFKDFTKILKAKSYYFNKEVDY